MAGVEHFSVANSSAGTLHSIKASDGSSSSSSNNSNSNSSSAARQRRISSGLPAVMHIGDTGAPGLATSLAHLNNGTAKANTNTSTSTSTSPPPSSSSSKRPSCRRKARSLVHRARSSLVIQTTWAIPLVLLVVVLTLYALNPRPSNPMHKFIFLSYALRRATPDAPVHYAKGPADLAFVAFYTVVLSFTRELVMHEMLKPLARYCGLRSRGKQARFMEQVYMALYTGTLGVVGMYVMSRTPVWYFSTRGMYEDYPHRTHEGLVKFYYLFQAAFWAQQAIVLMLGIEARRKDFKELVVHHILSVALIGLSYRFHFTHIGLAVYTTHDISDFFLATSKTLNYVNSPLTMPYFALFASVWIYFRHYINLQILWSILTEFRTVGPYELNWQTQQYKCLLSQTITFVLLAALQGLNLFWLFCILRIAYRFAVHKVAKDDRSEAEDDEGDEEEDKDKDKQTRRGHGSEERPAETPTSNPSKPPPQSRSAWTTTAPRSQDPGQSHHAHLRLRG